MADHTPTPRQVRWFVLTQWGFTAVFVVVMAIISSQFNRPTPHFPPIWVIVLLLAVVAGAAVLAERSYMSVTPLSHDDDSEVWSDESMRAFTSHTARVVMICVVPLLVAAMVSVVWAGSWGPWPLAITALPAFAVLAWESWPHSRNTSIVAAVLDADGAECGLVRQFLRS